MMIDPDMPNNSAGNQRWPFRILLLILIFQVLAQLTKAFLGKDSILRLWK